MIDASKNRLDQATSPYLLQHAGNPVAGQEWGDAAFAEAGRRDRPILLSVGYAACHWCHVMAHESFEDPETAAVMNRLFVNVKVDREERPDVDRIYMDAVQAATGRGGWPMTVFLTPTGEPFYAGTYFPPEDRGGMPGFRRVLEAVSDAWDHRREEITGYAERLASAVGASLPAAEATPDRAALEAAYRGIESQYDPAHGGFGGAPKFPPHSALPLLFHQHRAAGNERLLFLATRTLEAMALGGIHDHVGGGFHRYATDAEWFLPHFEKMLYDNALLLRAYAEAFALTQDAFFRAVAAGIAGWVAREMTHPEGGFYCALDAESEGVEGKFYVWTKAEVLEALGPDEGEAFCRLYGIEAEGNYREERGGEPLGPAGRGPGPDGVGAQGRTGATIAHLKRRLAESAGDAGPAGDLEARMRRARQRLLAVRERRPRPHR
ncbi:MAG: thioredoxin domain-containing protein, partial [Acidimicrobiia bacterium]|nr:thioredoxin domain-containing protein [Acidimicrobiia bacterium]